MDSASAPPEHCSRSLLGVLGGAGVVVGGWLADRMGARAARWRLQIPAIGHSDLRSVLGDRVCRSRYARDTRRAHQSAQRCSTFHAGPTFAIVQSAVPPPMRALAAALLLLATSLIGFGFGPLLIGRLSDVLAATYGADSLRVALADRACAVCVGRMPLLRCGARTRSGSRRYQRWDGGQGS